jgi:HPt (histidine-containing phosphotransfer) domain-containing protein
MLERDQSRQPDEAVQDADAWREACAVFGDEAARSRLCAFRKELAGHLARIGQGRLDDAALREIAHRTAGRAGFLGFKALTEASVALDEAARRRQGVAAALERWAHQAGRVAQAPQD